MSDGIFADKPDVLRAADMADQYAAGTWHHAGSKCSAKNCAAVWVGYFCESQHDERNPYGKFCDSCRKICGKKIGIGGAL